MEPSLFCQLFEIVKNMVVVDCRKWKCPFLCDFTKSDPSFVWRCASCATFCTLEKDNLACIQSHDYIV